jgi:hypothetical protein
VAKSKKMNKKKSVNEVMNKKTKEKSLGQDQENWKNQKKGKI